MAATNKPCAYTNCFLQPTCAKGLFPTPTLQNTTALITRNPQKFTIIDYITQDVPKNILGTHFPLGCGGDAYVLDKGKQNFRLGTRFPSIRHYATTFRPKQLGISTEILLLASHRMAPTDERSFVLKFVSDENGRPLPAVDDLLFAKSESWALKGFKERIIKQYSSFTLTLRNACNGNTVPPLDLGGLISVDVHIDEIRRDLYDVTLCLQSDNPEDGVRCHVYSLSGQLMKDVIVKELRSHVFFRY